MLELTESLKALLQETAERLKGHERRRFIAQTVDELGPGGQRLAERELGWNRGLIRKGKREVESEIIWLYRVCYANVAGDTKQGYATTADSIASSAWDRS